MINNILQAIHDKAKTAARRVGAVALDFFAGLAWFLVHSVATLVVFGAGLAYLLAATVSFFVGQIADAMLAKPRDTRKASAEALRINTTVEKIKKGRKPRKVIL